MVIHRHQHALHAMCSWRTTAACTALWVWPGGYKSAWERPHGSKVRQLSSLVFISLAVGSKLGIVPV
jgi:hypothetical protein